MSDVDMNRPPDADEYGGADMPSHDKQGTKSSEFADMLEQAAESQGHDMTDEERAKMREGMSQLEGMFDQARNTDWKAEAGNMAKNSAQNSLRRMVYSFILSFTLNNSEYKKERMLNRIEAGENIGLFELFFGEKFGVGFILRWVILIVFVGGFAFYLWQQGVFG